MSALASFLEFLYPDKRYILANVVTSASNPKLEIRQSAQYLNLFFVCEQLRHTGSPHDVHRGNDFGRSVFFDDLPPHR